MQIKPGGIIIYTADVQYLKGQIKQKICHKKLLFKTIMFNITVLKYYLIIKIKI